jgi:hypothetical protein
MISLQQWTVIAYSGRLWDGCAADSRQKRTVFPQLLVEPEAFDFRLRGGGRT